jgi:hypothetical protein
MRPRILLAASLLALGGTAAPAQPFAACATLDTCLARLGEEMGDEQRAAFQARLRSFGAPAADALVARLSGADAKAADAAGLALAQFERIDPRHLPALIAAHRAGNGWMPRAIAATAADEALRHLQASFLRNPDFSNNTQVHFALPRFGERLRPFVEEQAERCRAGGDSSLCGGLIALIGEFRAATPSWAPDALAAIAASPNEWVRRMGEDALIQRRLPAGLPLLKARLERLGVPGARDESAVHTALAQLGAYGPAGADAGPLVAALLESDDGETRAQAALTLARIGSSAGAERLIALEPGFQDDWLIAYNAVEALGRNRVAKAKPLLQRTARGHWHRAVRANAGRALASLAGGTFEAPGAPPGPSRFLLSELRYGDDAKPARFCGADRVDFVEHVAQDPPAQVAWPPRGVRRLSPVALPAPRTDPLRASIPNGRGGGRIPFRLDMPAGTLFGLDQGEFGGGLVLARTGNEAQVLAEGNPRFAFRMGERLYVAQGLSHIAIDRGSILVLEGSSPRIVRRIRLPAEPDSFFVTPKRVMIVRTSRGDVAIRADGRLAKPENVAPCRESTK